MDVDHLPGAVALFDRAGRLIDANATFSVWTGEDRARLDGRPLSDFFAAQPAEEADDFARLRHSDGSERPVLLTRTVTDDGEIVLLVDATARLEYESQLARRRSLEERTRIRLELIIQASIAFATATTERELAEILASTVARAYQAEQSAVYFTTDDGHLEQVAGTNPLDESMLSSTLVADVAVRRRTLMVSGAEEGDAFSAQLGSAMRAHGVHSILAMPIRHDDILIGVFGCFFLHPRQFDWEAAPLADALAGQAGQTATTLRLQRQLQHAAMHDETTGLPNRRLLEAQLVASVQSTPALIATLFIDLDGFKIVNDTLGHHVGDLLLREVGARLQASVREDDFVARYGGDEFVVVCAIPEVGAAHDVAERIRQTIALPFNDLPDGASVRASIGMSIARPQGPTWNPDQLIRVADHAMYAAKSAGGNRIVDIRLDDTAHDRAEIPAAT